MIECIYYQSSTEEELHAITLALRKLRVHVKRESSNSGIFEVL